MHARRAHYTHNEADPAPCLSEHRLAGPGSAKLDDGELTLGRGAVGNVGNMVADLEVLELGNDAIGARPFAGNRSRSAHRARSATLGAARTNDLAFLRPSPDNWEEVLLGHGLIGGLRSAPYDHNRGG